MRMGILWQHPPVTNHPPEKQHMNTRAIAIAAAMSVAAIAQWAILRVGTPLFNFVPDWIYRPIESPMTHGWVFALVCLSGLGVAGLVLGDPQRHRRNLCLIVAFGCAVHFGFVAMANRGLDTSAGYGEAGHGEYVTLAAEGRNMLDTVRDYESLLKSGELGHHPHSKPPGHLLFYMLTDRCAGLFGPAASEEARVKRLALVIAIVWPLLAALCVAPLYHFCLLVVEPSEAMIACLLFACVPCLVTLNTLCLDVVLYPALFMASLVVVLQSCRKGSWPLALAAGALLFTCTFVSFSLLPIYAIGPLFLLCYRSPVLPPASVWPRTGKALVGMGVGVMATYLAFRLLFGYDAWTRFNHAMAFHRQGMAWQPTLGRSWYFVSLNFAEFWFYLGSPLVVLSIVSVARAIRKACVGQAEVLGGFCLCVLIIQVLLAALGGAKHETSRYWTFLVPLLCLFGAREVVRLWRGGLRWGVWSVMVLQLVTALMIARY